MAAMELRTQLTVNDSEAENDSHATWSRVNESASHIGLAFMVRDLIMDAVGFSDDRIYIRLGVLCQAALDGLKLDTTVDVVQWLLRD